MVFIQWFYLLNRMNGLTFICAHVANAIAFIFAIHWGITEPICAFWAMVTSVVMAISFAWASVTNPSATAYCNFFAVNCTVCAFSPSIATEFWFWMDGISIISGTLASVSGTIVDQKDRSVVLIWVTITLII